jgi:hypothetical protein
MAPLDKRCVNASEKDSKILAIRDERQRSYKESL